MSKLKVQMNPKNQTAKSQQMMIDSILLMIEIQVLLISVIDLTFGF